jgi:enediyne biosynthesis protein E4
LNRREVLMACLATGLLPQKRRASPKSSAQAPPIFREVAAETGLDFFLYGAPTRQHYMPEIIGAGVALFDYDNDGDLDVFLLQGGRLDSGSKPILPPPAGWKPGHRLFRNMLTETGKLHFVDVTEKAGVGHVGYGMGVAVGDYDSDGFQDIYVTNFGHNILYHNNGNGTFTDVTQQAGVDDHSWSTSAAWVDYDADGRLDLFVCNYVDFTLGNNKRCFAPVGEVDYCSPRAYPPLSARLFHNLGNGKFEDVTASSGIGSLKGYGLGVICADFNGDGLVDIYVANDSAANYLWLNQGNGTFKEGALEAGLAYSADGLAKAGMGLSADDIDHDGHLEIVVTNLTGEGVTLFRSDGQGLYDDATAQFRLAQETYGYTGYGVGFLDYDNNGLLDLFVANGAMTIIESTRARSQGAFPYAQKSQLFRNEGPGKGFLEVTDSAGAALQSVEVGRGAAFGDINNDGAVDIVVTNQNGRARLYLNQAAGGQHWLLVRLEAAQGNRFGMGAEVGVLRHGQPTLWRRAHTDGSMLSASDIRVHFGLGKDPQLDAVVVHWPGGLKERWTNIKPDRIISLRQGSGTSE